MKIKIQRLIVALSLAGGLFITSCMGSWGLTKALYEWNDGVSGNKFVDNLLFWVLLGGVGAYPIAITLDLFVFNLIEFWTGSNPVAMAPGEYEKQNVAFNGKEYLMEARQNQMTITDLASNEVYELNYITDKQAWNMTMPSGETRELLNITEAQDAIVVHTGESSYILSKSDLAKGEEAWKEAFDAQVCN